MNAFTLLFLLSTVLPALLSTMTDALQTTPQTMRSIRRSSLGGSHITTKTRQDRSFLEIPMAVWSRTAPVSGPVFTGPSSIYQHRRPFMMMAASPSDPSLHDADNDGGNDKVVNVGTKTQSLRDRMRNLTGFSFTVFRATLRGITGVSLTAIYASAVAVSGLWIRKLTSMVLSLFPSGFRYFLQPLLVLYYAPLFILRSLTGPTRQRAIAQHKVVLDGWREAVQYAEKTEKDGYWPVVVNDDGYFEMVSPPSPTSTITSDDARTTTAAAAATTTTSQQLMADALAETVEHAMEVNTDSSNSHP